MNLPPFKVKPYGGQSVRYIEQKADGHSIAVYRGQTLSVLTRRDINICGKLPRHLQERLHRLPRGTCFRAELHAPGVQATSVPTMINDGDPRLTITPFYNPRCSNRDEFLSWARTHELDTPEGERRQRVGPVATGALKRRAVQLGIEGYIVYRYYHGKRWKIKPTRTVDCVVMEAEQSFSDTWFPGLKCLHVGVYRDGKLKQIARVGSGFSGEYRLSLDTPAKRKALEGRVCEVEYDDIAAGGQLKFPRFVRWREDKPAEECDEI